MSKLIEICKLDFCTACEACKSACPTKAIEMKSNNKGFLFPEIDYQKCIGCNICVKVCPANEIDNVKANKNNQKVYVAWFKNKQVRKESSSGGLFSAISNYIISTGGVVFGAKWTDDFSVVIDYCTDIDGLKSFRGSKYVQAIINDNYEIAKSFLDKGKIVLFSGTPCQIAGLKAYLKTDYFNLITLDLICHGVPSPMVFKSYLNDLEKHYHDKVSKISFRFKKPAWSSSSVLVNFKNKRTYINSTQIDPYFVGFNQKFFIREACLECKYSNINRLGDVTIADFWGFRPTNWKMRDFDKGCSAIILNSEKGINLFKSISKNLVYEENSMENVIQGNRGLLKPYPKAANSDEFWREFLKTKDFGSVSKKYFFPNKLIYRNNITRIKEYLFLLLPKPILNIVKEFKNVFSRC